MHKVEISPSASIRTWLFCPVFFWPLISPHCSGLFEVTLSNVRSNYQSYIAEKEKKAIITLILRKSGTFTQFIYPGHTIYFGPFGKMRTEVFEKGSTDYVHKMCCENCCFESHTKKVVRWTKSRKSRIGRNNILVRNKGKKTECCGDSVLFTQVSLRLDTKVKR